MEYAPNASIKTRKNEEVFLWQFLNVLSVAKKKKQDVSQKNVPSVENRAPWKKSDLFLNELFNEAFFIN